MQPELQGWNERFFDAFRKGEEHAFDRVFRAYHGPLTYYAFQYLQNEQLAEDIVQDCFVELWERRGKLVDVRQIGGYLYRCVYNHCHRWLDKAEYRALPAPPEEDREPFFILESQVLESILQVIDHLPVRLKQVVRMYYLEEKSLDEIGQSLGIDPESARKNRYRAIQLIRKTFSSTGATKE